MLKFYGYKNCGTCRKAEKYLKGKKQDFQNIPIREKPPTKKEILYMLKNSGKDIQKMFNVSGQDYRKLNLKDKLPKLSQDKKIDLLINNGNLVKRPMVLGKGVALVGFKLDEWNEIF